MLEDAEAWMGSNLRRALSTFLKCFDIMIPHLFPFVKWGRKNKPLSAKPKGEIEYYITVYYCCFIAA